jgi:fibronectin type 3 domain-containing protein
VYVGGWNSGGRLVAHLSDGSAADYVNTAISGTGQYDAVFTLTYSAGSAGQQLVVQWTQASGTGNVTLQGVALAGSQSGAPNPPLGVAASDGNPTSVTVTWNASATATSYSVYRSTTQGQQGSSVGTTNNTSLTDTSVTPNVQYYYSVVATNASGSSATSAQDGGYAGTLLPDVPTGVAASDGTSPTSVTVTWNVSSRATGYSIFRANTQGGTESPVGTSTTTSFTDSTVTAGVQYYYSVAATNSAGSSAHSAQDGGFAGTLPSGGSLSGSGVASATAVNLTNAGTSDWAKWPNYIHKASGASQISNFTKIGTPAVQSYANDLRPMTWTDGTPTATGTNNVAGNYIVGVGNGFQISAPADTTTRTLLVYVGGWNSGGRLTAHLSDGSAADFVNTAFSATGQYDVVYTLTYSAASSGQQLVVQWTQASGTGNVTVQAVALAGSGSGPPVPGNVSATDGTSATTVTVSWSVSAGATGYSIFRSTSAGQTGNQVGTSTTTAFTDSTVTAGVLYYYSVVATNGSGSSQSSAQDSGFAGSLPSGGSLTGSGVLSTTAVNLTTTGTSDWAKWPNYIHKASGGAKIANFTKIGTPAVQTYNTDPRPISWTDGTPTATGTNDISGNYIAGVGNGFQVTAPADTTTRTLILYVGGWTSGGRLVAHLSDGSAADFVDTSFSSTNATYKPVYTLTYRAASAGQQLTVQWTQASGTGNVTVQAAALQ